VDAALHAADDRRMVRSMARAVRDHEKVLHEIAEATRVQRSRLPSLPLKRGRWRIGGGLLPCRFIGGDVFDLMPGMRGSQILSLIDVPGSGLAAALVAATVSSQLRALVRTHDLAEAMKLLNLQLSWERASQYSSIGVVELNQHRAVVINAGLPPISLVSEGGCCERIEGSGLPPGLVGRAEYEPCELLLQPGDRLVLMSNGLTDPFGRFDEVRHCLKELGLLAKTFFMDVPTSDRLVERMRQMLQGAGALDRDDATLITAELCA
jgi:sigma-B regulation protein RsbU (phosphoserine phosphatase)